MVSTLAVIGTGIMGAPMARNAEKAGFAVTAWNRSRGKLAGFTATDTAAEAAAGADATIVMLSDGPTCDHVLYEDGEHGPAVLPAMTPGARLVVMSSIPVETARGQAERAAAAGIGYLDAPVSGGEKGAIEASLAIMAGGAASDFDAMAPVFRSMGRPTLVGPAGSGQLAKLANQMIVGNTIATVAEALILAAKGGADPAAVREALLGGFADSTILKLHGQRMVEENWTPGAFSRYQLKDLRTAMGFAKSLGLDLPVTDLTTQLFEDTVAHGDSEKDHSAVYLELMRRNGE